MELDLQLTPRSRILLGILGAVLLVLVAIQVVPAFYRLFANQEAKAKREQLVNTENLVHAAEVLKPVEAEIYKVTGLADTENQQAEEGDQKAISLFDTQPPDPVIRARVDGLVRRAGIEQNYQLLTKPAAGKQNLKLTMQSRERLVLYLYLKHIEAEAEELTEIAAQEAEDESFDMLMDAWLSGTTESDTDEKTGETDEASGEASSETESAADVEPEDPTVEPEDPTDPSEYASLPEVIPLSLRVKLASYIKSMVTQQLRGVTDFRQGFFAAQVHKIETPVSPGIFGIGAKPATVEVQLRRNSPLLEILMQMPDEYAEEQPATSEFQSALVKYIEKIQEQRAFFLEQLALAPATYETQLYTVEMKFRTDLEKLVNLNHLIETNAKWLTVRDMRISADKQSSGAQRGRNRGGNDATNLNVDLFLIAQIF